MMLYSTRLSRLMPQPLPSAFVHVKNEMPYRGDREIRLWAKVFPAWPGLQMWDTD